MNEPIRLGMLNASGVPLRGQAVISGVYSITNVVSGARYIGSSTNIAMRWAGHRSAFRGGRVSVNQRIGVALLADGINAFAVELLETVVPEDTALEVAERRWIEQYASADRDSVYNIIMSGHREPVKRRRPDAAR